MVQKDTSYCCGRVDYRHIDNHDQKYDGSRFCLRSLYRFGIAGMLLEFEFTKWEQDAGHIYQFYAHAGLLGHHISSFAIHCTIVQSVQSGFGDNEPEPIETESEIKEVIDMVSGSDPHQSGHFHILVITMGSSISIHLDLAMIGNFDPPINVWSSWLMVTRNRLYLQRIFCGHCRRGSEGREEMLRRTQSVLTDVPSRDNHLGSQSSIQLSDVNLSNAT